MLRPKPGRLQRLVPEPTETAMKAIEIYREVIFEDGFPHAKQLFTSAEGSR